VQTLIPLDRVVISKNYIINKKEKEREKRKNLNKLFLQKGLTYLRGSGISPNGNSPKFDRIGSFENCKCDSLGVTLYMI
jgi:hypothetical protein